MSEPKQSSAKSFRWYSTVESAENLEFSVRAAAESVGAVIVSLSLAWYFQTYTHLVVAIVVAPLLLLRTEESVELGLRWFGGFSEGIRIAVERFAKQLERFANRLGIISKTPTLLISLTLFVTLLDYISFVYSWILITLICLYIWSLLFAKLDKSVEPAILIFIIMLFGIEIIYVGIEGVGIEGVVIGVVVVVVVSLIIKFAATTFTCFQQLLLRRSGNCLHMIPLNWYRIVLATDMRHPPELLPGIESPRYQALTDKFSNLRFSGWMGFLTTQENVGVKMLFVIIAIILYLPAILYRLSLKSSALFYLPFLWIIGTAKARQNFRESIDEQYVLWRYTLSGQLIVAYSWIIVIFAFLQLFLKIQFHDFSTQANYSFLEPVMPFIVNFQWNVWDVTRFLSAFLTLVLWFWIDKLSALKEHGIEKDVTNEIDMIFYLKRLCELLAGYTYSTV